MSFDASSLPPSLIPDCEPGMSRPAPPDEPVTSLIDSLLRPFSRSLEPGGPDPTTPVSRASRLGGVSRFIKRSCDYAITVSALLVLWPVLLLIAALIRLDSKGPVLFRQRRLGLGGRPFWLLKYRTMVVDAEERLEGLEHLNESDGGVLFKMKRDPRVTRFGSFLRRSSLDELPQLINVLRGEMSLVGPRPLQLRDCTHLERLAPREFARRLEVLPGLTGPWQVSGRSELGYERMLSLDLDYIDNGGIAADFRILWQSLRIVLLRRGAY
jgi:lipopolysaccharide/colanic/teichoic acid biosynthesis glycosyltransferase